MGAYRSWVVAEFRRKTKLKAVKFKGGKCERCGYSKSIAAMDFHHRDPAKKDFSVGQAVRSWEVVLREIKKCDLLCANCHAEVEDAKFTGA